jgi:hypothetical protein
MFIASDTLAQQQYCECYDSVKTVSVRRAPVRRVAHRVKAKRSYRTARVRTNRTVYVPASRVASYVAYSDDDCGDVAYVPTRRVVVTQPVYTTTYSTVSAYGYDTERIARGWGRRDGFKDGWKAALKNRPYNVENNGDFRDANNGYKRRFGSKFLYKTAYRDGYAVGYDSGYRSVAGGERYGIVRY